MRILLLDIETAPNLAHVWGLWNQNVGLSQLIEPGYTLCWAAKWFDEPEVYFQSIHSTTPRKMVKAIHDLIEQADAVVHYNGNKFDMPTLQKDFLLQGFAPPAPTKQIDLLLTVRKRFRFPSNKLDYVAQQLKVGKKVKHERHELWLKCMGGDEAAWRKMEAYNRQDVLLLERVYKKVRPWIRNHPNHGLYDMDDSLMCTACGSKSYQRRGIAHTTTCSYHRFQCKRCGHWFRSVRNVGPKPSQKFTHVA